MEEQKNDKQQQEITWKAIVAVVLVMAALFAMSSLVNAGIVELILGEEYEAVATASSSSEHTHTSACYTEVSVTRGCVPSGTSPLGIPLCSALVEFCPGNGSHKVTIRERTKICGYPD